MSITPPYRSATQPTLVLWSRHLCSASPSQLLTDTIPSRSSRHYLRSLQDRTRDWTLPWFHCVVNFILLPHPLPRSIIVFCDTISYAPCQNSPYWELVLFIATASWSFSTKHPSFDLLWHRLQFVDCKPPALDKYCQIQDPSGRLEPEKPYISLIIYTFCRT